MAPLWFHYQLDRFNVIEYPKIGCFFDHDVYVKQLCYDIKTDQLPLELVYMILSYTGDILFLHSKYQNQVSHSLLHMYHSRNKLSYYMQLYQMCVLSNIYATLYILSKCLALGIPSKWISITWNLFVFNFFFEAILFLTWIYIDWSINRYLAKMIRQHWLHFRRIQGKSNLIMQYFDDYHLVIEWQDMLVNYKYVSFSLLWIIYWLVTALKRKACDICCNQLQVHDTFVKTYLAKDNFSNTKKSHCER